MKLNQASRISLKELLLARIICYAAFNFNDRGIRKMNI